MMRDRSGRTMRPHFGWRRYRMTGIPFVYIVTMKDTGGLGCAVWIGRLGLLAYR